MDESRFVMSFINILEVTETLHSFRLVPNKTTGKEIPKSPRLELIEKVLANNFPLSDTEDKTLRSLNREGKADLLPSSEYKKKQRSNTNFLPKIF